MFKSTARKAGRRDIVAVRTRMQRDKRLVSSYYVHFKRKCRSANFKVIESIHRAACSSITVPFPLN